MGGYHVAHRATNDSKYIGIASTLKLPNNCNCQDDSAINVFDGVFPEFIHGFYKNGYGLDVGVIYRKENFKLFYHSLSNTCATPDGDTIIDVSKGDIIELKTYLSNNKIVTEAWKDSVKLDSLSIELTSAASKAFAGGAKINRELVIAANRNPYIPCNAYFSDTTFSRSTLTSTNYEYTKLRISNSSLLRYPDEGTMDGNRYGYLSPTEDSNGYVIDTGSCDFR